jgi:hypothetical protein
MANADVPERPPVEAWQVESIRLTAFPSEPVEPLAQRWWKGLLGEEAEARSEKPREPEAREEGKFASGRLCLTVQPLRIDWRVDVQTEPGELEDPLATLGPLPEVLPAFRELMQRWLQSEECPALKRLALGAILFQPVEDRVGGYRVLSRYLKALVIDAEGSSDLSYAINRRRERELAQGVSYVNRLSRWSVAVAVQHTAHLGIVEGKVSKVTSIQEEQPRFACRLQLDINTPADFQGQLPPGKTVGILQELIDLGVEIAEKGDIP